MPRRYPDSFMDAEGRQKIPGSETLNLITHIMASNMSLSIFAWAPIFTRGKEESQVIPTHAVECITERSAKVRELKSYNRQ